MDDEARQGAPRFAEQAGGPFLREEGDKRIPPLVELPKLLSAAEHVMEEKDTEEDLRLLFAPGSSLGGARPKASVIEKDGQLTIAKFPRKDDEINDAADLCSPPSFLHATSPSWKAANFLTAESNENGHL